MDEADGYGSGQASAGSVLLNSIKQRQTVAADDSNFWERASPKEGFDLSKPRVQAKVESSKLRELLNLSKGRLIISNCCGFNK